MPTPRAQSALTQMPSCHRRDLSKFKPDDGAINRRYLSPYRTFLSTLVSSKNYLVLMAAGSGGPVDTFIMNKLDALAESGL
jgi:hypothetical protein